MGNQCKRLAVGRRNVFDIRVFWNHGNFLVWISVLSFGVVQDKKVPSFGEADKFQEVRQYIVCSIGKEEERGFVCFPDIVKSDYKFFAAAT